MTPRFYVIDGEGNASYSVKQDAPESFATEKAATARAKELAESYPGQEIHICKTVAIAIAQVQKVSIEK